MVGDSLLWKDFSYFFIFIVQESLFDKMQLGWVFWKLKQPFT